MHMLIAHVPIPTVKRLMYMRTAAAFHPGLARGHCAHMSTRRAAARWPQTLARVCTVLLPAVRT